MAERTHLDWTYLGILAVALVAGFAFFVMSRSSDESRAIPEGPELEELIQNAAAWLQEERDLHRPEARALTETERIRFDPFFPEEFLDTVRVRLVPRFKNPEFLTDLTEPGEPLILDFRSATAMAVIDTVLAIEHLVTPGSEGWLGLLFHELVHLVQIQTLGTDGFLRSYLQGMRDANLHYPDFPHEAQAFELQRRFESNPTKQFSVVDEVERRF